MISPSIPASDVSGIFALLAFLTDAEACKARLSELQIAAKDSETALDSLLKTRAEVSILQTEAQVSKARLDSLSTDLEAQKALLNDSAKALMQERQVFATKSAQLMTEIAERTLVVENRESVVLGREQAIDGKLDIASWEADKAKGLRQELESKLIQLKQITG